MSSIPTSDSREHPQSVETTLNFLGEMSEPPASYAYDPPPGQPPTNMKIARHRVAIRDARPIEPQLSLDREGVEVLRRPTAVKDFFDDAEVTRVYYPECERLVKEATGAVRVLAFDYIVRSATRRNAGAKDVKIPAKGVHNDYTDASGPQRVRDLLPGQAKALLENRVAIINVWRPVNRPVQESPLAVCDAASIEPADLVPHARIYPDRRGEIQAVRYNAGQRWYYFPRMAPEEAMLLKCYDSAQDGRARFTAHTAFDDPTSPPDAHPRESIEVRTLVFFAPGK